jgi:hypothetical protein
MGRSEEGGAEALTHCTSKGQCRGEARDLCARRVGLGVWP